MSLRVIDTEDLQGRLRLGVHHAVLKGGDRERVILPSDPDENLLIQAICHGSLEMPPNTGWTIQ